MKNSRRNLIVACVLSVIAALIWLYWPKEMDPVKSPPLAQGNSSTPSPSTPYPNGGTKVAVAVSQENSSTSSPSTPYLKGGTKVAVAVSPSLMEINKRKEEQINALYLTPIAVYGKVVDESGKPVSGATVEIGIADKPLQTSSKHTQSTNEGGAFSLTDVHGIAFSLRASKKGYYTTKESRGQRNVVTPSNNDVPQPLKEEPITLVLRQQGQTIPLIAMSSGQINVPRTGQSVNIDLATGRTGQGDLQVSAWIGDNSQRQFDWRYQLSIPSGGVIERKGQYDFEAPADGYQSATEINMSATAEGWTSDLTKNYFAKLPDGRYARFSINFYPGQRNFVVIESYINPTRGSRNLEFDPNKPVQP